MKLAILFMETSTPEQKISICPAAGKKLQHTAGQWVLKTLGIGQRLHRNSPLSPAEYP